MNNNFLKAGIILAICCGILLRIVVISNQSEFPDYSGLPYTDEIHYHQLAENLIDFKSYAAYSQGFYSTSTRPPLYPAFLSVFSFLSNHSNRAHHVLNFVFDLLNLYLIFLLGTLLYGMWCGALSTLIYTLYGPAFIFITAGTSEILVVSLILSSAIHLICITRTAPCTGEGLTPSVSGEGKWRFVIGFVISYALLIHARPAFLLLLPLIPVLGLFRPEKKGRPKRFLTLCLSVTLVSCFLIPWGIRNYSQHEAVIPVCTMAGWHVAAHARSLTELPIELMWRYVYDPGRREYTEGDYYREATNESIKLAISTPIKSTLIGIQRIIHTWGFEKPYIRFFLPKSYVYPVYLGDSSFLPMIDFEGLCYMAFIGVFISWLVGCNSFWCRMKRWVEGAKEIIGLLLLYIIIHIISIPMVQYRFVIEPIIVVLIVGLLLTVIGGANTIRGVSSNVARMSVVPTIMFILLGITFLTLYSVAYAKDSVKTVNYKSICNSKRSASTLNFHEIRQIQWEHLGVLPFKRSVEISGEIRYIANDYKFLDSQITAIPSRGSVAKLFVEKYSTENALGIGDVKLNFQAPPSGITDGDIICVTGLAGTDPFREIIINVQHYQLVK